MLMYITYLEGALKKAHEELSNLASKVRVQKVEVDSLKKEKENADDLWMRYMNEARELREKLEALEEKPEGGKK